MTTSKIAGIDYGSKLAGTTVIAFYEAEKPVRLYQSEKKKDADKFIREILQVEKPAAVFLDAPLSLPGIYRNLPDCTDYFYRKGDRALRAMSPMFLGALTARAIKLKDELTAAGFAVHEIYPAALARVLELKEADYKGSVKSIPACLALLQKNVAFTPAETVKNWHQFDALLALASGLRYLKNAHEIHGEAEEGAIIF